MTDSAPPLSPGSGPDPGPVPGVDTDDAEVVPAALTSLVASARSTYQAMVADSAYPVVMAVGAVEDTVAVLGRISARLQGYVGDFSRPGEAAVVRASDLLGQARTALGDARHLVTLDELAERDPTPPILSRAD